MSDLEVDNLVSDKEMEKIITNDTFSFEDIIELYQLKLPTYMKKKSFPWSEKIARWEKLGFIEIVFDLRSNLKQLTISNLKEILHVANLPITGKKEVLIERMLDGMDHEILSQIYSNVTYTFTSKGEALLNEHDYLDLYGETV